MHAPKLHMEPSTCWPAPKSASQAQPSGVWVKGFRGMAGRRGVRPMRHQQLGRVLFLLLPQLSSPTRPWLVTRSKPSMTRAKSLVRHVTILSCALLGFSGGHTCKTKSHSPQAGEGNANHYPRCTGPLETRCPGYCARTPWSARKRGAQPGDDHRVVAAGPCQHLQAPSLVCVLCLSMLSTSGTAQKRGTLYPVGTLSKRQL
jgi:hypothetical protein